MLKITNISEDSLGEFLNFSIGDTIIAFNGEEVKDILDYAYYDSMEQFSVTVRHSNGQDETIEVRKHYNSQLGLDFAEECYLTPDWCTNNCVFCFVNQLPTGMRESLYVKDDDWRLSFVSGNYVTLTNITEEEIQRIINRKISPLFVSVHSTNDEVRRRLLGREDTPSILPLLIRFANGGISLNAQIVLCPGINDGSVLKNTLSDLFSLYPAVTSVAVVPVGLTKFRDNLPELTPVDITSANDVINLVEEFAETCNLKKLTNFAFCSDEFYYMADRQLPDYKYYGDFEQYENGVGLIARLFYDWNSAFDISRIVKEETFTIVTGQAAYPYINILIEDFNEKFGSSVQVVAITNDFFGDTVNVAGLVVASDIINQLKDLKLNETIILPRCMLKETEDVFLDNVTLEQLAEQLNHKIEIVDVDGYELFNLLVEEEE